MLLPHEAPYPLFIDLQRLDETEVRLDAAVAPERMLRLERLDAGEQACIALADLQSPSTLHPNSSSLLFHSRVGSPTSCLSRAFCCSRRASCRVC